ncbi:hypothetical protein BKA64DRAFT_396537 [Cadophora sp. MPI-SDFR-AT-0126]|nr:hypothetical protein BKA64DRAFT_396537 [Leotiomycetes sp. MPI-SDFR-AT-0126]
MLEQKTNRKYCSRVQSPRTTLCSASYQRPARHRRERHYCTPTKGCLDQVQSNPANRVREPLLISSFKFRVQPTGTPMLQACSSVSGQGFPATLQACIDDQQGSAPVYNDTLLHYERERVIKQAEIRATGLRKTFRPETREQTASERRTMADKTEEENSRKPYCTASTGQPDAEILASSRLASAWTESSQDPLLQVTISTTLAAGKRNTGCNIATAYC